MVATIRKPASTIGPGRLMVVSYPTAELRLVYACALIETIHEADMATLFQPVWTVPTTGERVLYVQTPFGHRARLPIESFDNQITSKLYNPTSIQVLLGRYKYTQVHPR